MHVLPLATGGGRIESGGESAARCGYFEWGEEYRAVVHHGEGAGAGGAVCAQRGRNGRRRSARPVCDYRASGCGWLQHCAAGLFAGGESPYGPGRKSEHYFPDTDAGVWSGVDRGDSGLGDPGEYEIECYREVRDGNLRARERALEREREPQRE